MRTRVKFCGLTRVEDIHSAVQVGVDALGFVLYPKSKRALSLQQACQLRSHVPALIDIIALVVNPTVAEVQAIIKDLKPHAIQFHGDESPEFCEQFNYPYWRAVRVGAPELETEQEIADYVAQFPHAQAFLFDAYSTGFGGAGVRFDLSLLYTVKQAISPEKVIIAGGINALNIAALSGQYYAVDLSSGIESEPGVKSAELMQQFMQALR
ncbi:MAG: phosphoribosylanthranilate isomerase [Pelistega sp.]|nr:phosphoribosylanthranilate isomerase [Pelistega sp.]